MRIVFPDGAACMQHPDEIAALRRIGQVDYYDAPPPDKATLIERLRPAEAVVLDYSEMDAEVLAACPELRLISFLGIGYASAIDVAEATRRGVAVAYTPDYGATSVAEFRAKGYLPEALVNYLALIGWSPGDGEELLPLAELARRFELSTVAHSAGVFDVEKLAWANRHYLKAADPARLAHLAVPFLRREQWVTEPTPGDLNFLTAIVPVAASSKRCSQNRRRLWGSTPAVGSSSTRSSGAWIVAAVSASRCFQPPESAPARVSA